MNYYRIVNAPQSRVGPWPYSFFWDRRARIGTSRDLLRCWISYRKSAPISASTPSKAIIPDITPPIGGSNQDIARAAL